MKIPKAYKLPSGSWTVRVQIDGRKINITKPTEAEAIAEATALKAGVKQDKASGRLTLAKAIDRYIEDRESICSPSTILGYRIIQKNRFKSMMGKDIFSVTQEQWQRAINAEAREVSGKTIKNAWGFVSSVIHEATGFRPSVTLPQVIDKTIPFLSAEDIPVFVKAIHGTSIEIPALLCLSSLRQSEMLALRWKDVDMKKKVLHIRGATVRGEDLQRVRKEQTKNSSSRRTVPIIPPLYEALKNAEHTQETVVTLAPNSIRNHINRICMKNDLPRVGIHGLRHSFASLAQHLNMPEKVVMELGGWSDYRTMKKIYTHISQADIAKRAEQITNFFNDNCAEESEE